MLEYLALEYLSSLIGWIYFILWSVSFYPQVLANHRRRSVTGLSFDFIVASFYGFLCYAIFNCSMYFSEAVRVEYRNRNDGKDNLVALNDVIFAVHAVVMTFILFIQVLMFKKPSETPSIVGLSLAILLTTFITIGAIVSIFGFVPILDYLYTLSFIKLILTIVKYIPQAWLNWIRRSTTGWSISQVMFDFFGGFFSISQLVLDAINSGHLAGIFGFITKLALGIISIFFDCIFVLQHYVWFPEGSGPHITTHESFIPQDPSAPSKSHPDMEK